jgi:hypothetical protein
MAEQAQEMVKEATPKKKAFMSRPYSQEERMKKDEEELEVLLKEQKGEEEKPTKKEMKLPKSDEDIEAWAKEYPDVAKIVETIAMKKAREQSEALESRIKEINQFNEETVKERAEVELMRLHPDFNDIRDSDDFHDWAEQQPKWVQNALYENQDDAKSAARAIDLYKADRGITGNKPTKTDKQAATQVKTKSSKTNPTVESTKKIKESDVQKMSGTEYEKNSDMIMEAIRSGNFIYDISGSAR